MIFEKKQRILNYLVTFPIKEGKYAEAYRVKDNEGKNYFLKLIFCGKLHHTQFDKDGRIVEVKIAKQLSHPNITCYHDSGEIIVNGQQSAFIVYDFIIGETVAQHITRDQKCSVYEAKQITLGVLNGLKFLHSLPQPVIHNEITTQNVMIDLSLPNHQAKIIDFGYARYQSQGTSSYMKEGLSPFYQAPEALNGVFSNKSDIFSTGALLYHMIFGMVPYFTELPIDLCDRNKVLDAIIEPREKPLLIPNITMFELDEGLINILTKALAIDINDRFTDVDEFIKALKGEIQVERVVTKNKTQENRTEPNSEETKDIKRKAGNGFKDVAGMTELKEQLQSDVIDLIQDPQQAKDLGITIPNGLLFYGPPGCGKTFFAEKFAEETRFNYKYIKCSDVASPYIHGGQEKIASIFNDARKNAPTILFFDEIDAMIKDRNKHNNVSEAGEVNEFLAQLNNCGQDGVLVIGATNKPKEIDEAALRAGRLEFKYYIPQPDLETRALIFEIILSKRKYDFGIDYEKLAKMTENYISADIKMIVDNAARLTFRRKLGKIYQSTLEEVISNSKPTISLEVIRKHEAIRDEFIGIKKTEQRRRVGF